MRQDPPSFGRYEVLREIARGGMGAVYEVRAPGDPRRLALKVIAGALGPEELARFGREAELMAKVSHPNLIGIHTLERTPSGQPFMVCDLIEGETLAELVRREAPSPEQIRSLLTGLCRGLEALHAQGILHRDLKPDNVLVRPDGTPVLLDFGIARELDTHSLTQSGALLGTPGFMAPEQAEGLPFSELDARTDVYGLGAILYFLLARRPPFVGSSLTRVLVATLEEPIDWSPAASAPPDLIEVAKRALARNPRARFADVAELREALSRPERGSSRAARAALPLGLALLAGVFALSWSALRPRTPAADLPPRPSPTQSPTPPSDAPTDAECQVLKCFHAERSGDSESGRVRFLSDGLFLQHCAHSSRLRWVERAPDAERWKGDDYLRIARGSHLAFPQDADYSRPPPWALAWERLGPYVGLDLRERVAHKREFSILKVEASAERRGAADLLRMFGKTAITAQHCRSSDHNLILAFASAPPARGPLRVFEFEWERRRVKRWVPERDFLDAPANVRDLANLIDGTTVAVGERAGGPPVRIWWIAGDRKTVGSWPPSEELLELPEHDGTAVVALHHQGWRFVLWGDRGGGIHLVRWHATRREYQREGMPLKIQPSFALDRLPGPVLGLALVWREGELLVFAGSGAAESKPEANELRVYALDVESQTLSLRAHRAQRPSGYTSVKVSHDARWVLAARADCALEAWPVAELLAPK